MLRPRTPHVRIIYRVRYHLNHERLAPLLFTYFLLLFYFIFWPNDFALDYLAFGCGREAGDECPRPDSIGYIQLLIKGSTQLTAFDFSKGELRESNLFPKH
ncbi:unnamed protein product [Calicophoron daubneyi]|uniref:Uncharacterized protein n=1 Tax=Calicophoron daubneyi TaxID=300641 RepID=A0AAV2TTX6_CALDB